MDGSASHIPQPAPGAGGHVSQCRAMPPSAVPPHTTAACLSTRSSVQDLGIPCTASSALLQPVPQDRLCFGHMGPHPFPPAQGHTGLVPISHTAQAGHGGSGDFSTGHHRSPAQKSQQDAEAELWACRELCAICCRHSLSIPAPPPCCSHPAPVARRAYGRAATPLHDAPWATGPPLHCRAPGKCSLRGRGASTHLAAPWGAPRPSHPTWDTEAAVARAALVLQHRWCFRVRKGEREMKTKTKKGEEEMISLTVGSQPLLAGVARSRALAHGHQCLRGRATADSELRAPRAAPAVQRCRVCPEMQLCLPVFIPDIALWWDPLS